MEKKQKKAQMHVEIIVSFVIFVGFLLFLLYFLNPVGKQNLSFSSLEKVQEKILDNVAISYRTVTLVLESAPSGDECYKFEANDFLSENLVAYDGEGIKREVSLKKSDKKIELQLKSGQRVYKISSFEGFVEEGYSPCNSNSPPSSWGLIENTGAVFEDYLAELKGYYESDYVKLKTDLGLQKDFDFVVYDENRAVLNGYDVRDSFEGIRGNEILSRDIPLTMVNNVGEKTKIILNLRVW